MILYLIGFAKEGVRAGSIASKWHSLIGVVPKKSVFAFLQRIGAKGILITPQGWLMVKATVIAGKTVYKFYKLRKDR